MLSTTDATGTTSYTYDALNQVTKKTLPNGQTISYKYDNDGNLLTKTDSAGTVTYAYGAGGEVTSVTDRQAAKTTLSYDQDGNNTQISFPNGVSEAMTYNSAGQLTKIAGASGNKTLTSYAYSYTNPSTSQTTGLPYSVTDVSGNVTSFSYDTDNQLTQALQKDSKGKQIASYGYGYDPAGHTTSKTVNGTSTTFTFNAANELTQASGGINKTYTYDANGALTAASNGLSLTYNPALQTTGITPPGGSAVSMTYTGQGQGERVAAGSSKYQYDATGLGTMSDTSGTTNLTCLPDGTLISESISSGTYYYLSDGAASVAGLTGSAGTLVDSYAYDPQRNITSQSGTVSNPFAFHGWMWDTGSGLYYTGGGYYDPSVAIFASGCHDLGPADTASSEDYCGEDEAPYDEFCKALPISFPVTKNRVLHHDALSYFVTVTCPFSVTDYLIVPGAQHYVPLIDHILYHWKVVDDLPSCSGGGLIPNEAFWCPEHMFGVYGPIRRKSGEWRIYFVVFVTPYEGETEVGQVHNPL